ncbi:MAG TPA: hypothetical protein VK747_04935 [Blastocatellia bacterium]|nr:hypothetical protein [Blastocatellia bacterium]
MALAAYKDNVFINCPFDNQYKPVLDALVFAVHDAGFVARCALEVSDATQNRLEKILRIISECRYGVHDISRTEIDAAVSLPRFNMPLELGLFLGCQRFGDRMQRTKSCLIMDREPYRYQRFISDIAGQDIYSHNNQPEQAIGLIGNWLRTESKRVGIPGQAAMRARYEHFQHDLPELCAQLKIQVEELTFVDYFRVVVRWLEKESSK